MKLRSLFRNEGKNNISHLEFGSIAAAAAHPSNRTGRPAADIHGMVSWAGGRADSRERIQTASSGQRTATVESAASGLPSPPWCGLGQIR